MHSPLMVSAVLYLIACCIPALEFKNSNSPNTVMWGANALAVGWSGIFAGVMAWYANPFWLLGLLLGVFHKKPFAVIAGSMGIAIACTAFSIIAGNCRATRATSPKPRWSVCCPDATFGLPVSCRSLWPPCL